MSRITYLRVSFVLQVEQEKQLTHQALLRADTTEGDPRKKEIMNVKLMQFQARDVLIKCHSCPVIVFILFLPKTIK